MRVTNTDSTDLPSYLSATESDIASDQIMDLAAFPPELLALFEQVEAEVLNTNCS